MLVHTQQTIFSILLLLALPGIASAQPPSTLLKIGDAAPEWKELIGTDDKPHALADFKAKEVLVIVFTCNSCPYAVEYEDRFIAFAKEHGGEGTKVAFVAMNANQVAEDLPPKMQEKAVAKKFNFLYLFDATQEVARAHGALYTPECFVFDKDRKLVYRGAFDDNPNAKEVKNHHVANAVAAALAGQQPAVTETPAIGCTVRYARKKRTK
jgi:thiol-disulfide isomerase/thioredoxin